MKSNTVTGLLALAATLAVGAACVNPATTALGTSEQCFNGLDDDDDGLIDCADPDCAGHYACDDSGRELLCTNGVDDDGDGLTDCADPDCAADQACNPDREVACADGVDNDGDSLTDCADPDCAATDACREVCDDGEDNDGDGFVDCEDPDCAPKPRCQPEICNNDLDDNEDGLVDCEDPQCASAPVCRTVVQPELCDNGWDDDLDGLVDCADPDCADNPWCAEVICDDGWDNDGNGLIDCEDPRCAGTPPCTSNEACRPAQAAWCGQTFFGTTAGRLSNFDAYACATGSYPGGEVYYSFTANGTMSIDVQLLNDSLAGDLRLIVLHGTASGCNAGDACESDAVTAGNVQERTVSLSTGQTVYFVVDSPQPAGGEFELTVSCPLENTETNCNDGLDNDFDGDVDCWDEDCLGSPHCGYWVSAGLLCSSDGDCAPGEWCLHPLLAGVPRQGGMCTRDCPVPGPTGDACYSPDFGQGHCVTDPNGQEAQCLLPCGTSGGTNPACPPSFVCANLQTGVVGNVSSGFCVPYY